MRADSLEPFLVVLDGQAVLCDGGLQGLNTISEIEHVSAGWGSR